MDGAEVNDMQAFFFAIKHGVPMRDDVINEFDSTAETIEQEFVQHIRDGGVQVRRCLRLPSWTRL